MGLGLSPRGEASETKARIVQATQGLIFHLFLIQIGHFEFVSCRRGRHNVS